MTHEPMNFSRPKPEPGWMPQFARPVFVPLLKLSRRAAFGFSMAFTPTTGCKPHTGPAPPVEVDRLGDRGTRWGKFLRKTDEAPPPPVLGWAPVARAKEGSSGSRFGDRSVLMAGSGRASHASKSTELQQFAPKIDSNPKRSMGLPVRRSLGSVPGGFWHRQSYFSPLGRVIPAFDRINQHRLSDPN